MTTNTPATQQPIEVFVTTENIVKREGMNTANGQWFNLANFANLEDFTASAITYAKTLLNEANPELIFAKHQAKFNVEVYIDDYKIRADIWDLLGLSEQDIELVLSYQAATITHNKPVLEALKMAKHLYVGKFYSHADFAKHVLSKQAEQLPAIFAQNLDWHGIADMQITILHPYLRCNYCLIGQGKHPCFAR